MNEKNAKVILLSSEENAAGIDLTEFNNVIVFEPFEDSTYCKEIYWQLVGRVHRNGQTKPVSVYRLIMMGTIEEIIYAKFLE
jgi:SNF2 family DNA or RNA helicase